MKTSSIISVILAICVPISAVASGLINWKRFRKIKSGDIILITSEYQNTWMFGVYLSFDGDEMPHKKTTINVVTTSGVKSFSTRFWRVRKIDEVR